VELPREVALVLRRDGGPLGALHPAPPLPEQPPLAAERVDQAGIGQALEAVRLTSALLEALGADPAPVLRSGGMGIRELRRLARTAGLEEPVAALLTEVSYAAGLIGEAEPSRGVGDASLRPTAGYDAWSGAPLAVRWHAVVTAWLAMARQPGLVGQRVGGTSGGRYRDRADKLIGALAPEAGRTTAPGARRAVLGVLAALPPGTAATVDEVVALVGWHAPRRAGGIDVAQVLSEAAALGVTGLGALTSYGAALLDDQARPDDDPLGVRGGDAPAGVTRAAARLDALLPSPVDELVVQADLTVIVPGPPEPALAGELELVAEHESAGGASVYRVSRHSLRRALDAGYAAEDLHELFARRSRTPVPQGLRYLIDDVARAHGGLRVGSAHAYLRSDDEALVAQVLADRRLAPLGLRRLAPTVLASGASTGRLLAALREAGYAPVPEDASGAAVLVRPRARRAPARPAVTAPADPFTASRMSRPRLLGIIEDIRRGDAAARAARRAPATIRANGTAVSAQAHTEAMAVLQQAVRDKALVWVRYVDAHGSSTSRLVRPVSIGAGYLRAEDERTDTLHTFALHRITAASLESA
jgi:alkylated DNA nucleotide flippase Atl1